MGTITSKSKNKTPKLNLDNVNTVNPRDKPIQFDEIPICRHCDEPCFKNDLFCFYHGITYSVLIHKYYYTKTNKVYKEIIEDINYRFQQKLKNITNKNKLNTPIL
jgi:hypothetical protein